MIRFRQGLRFISRLALLTAAILIIKTIVDVHRPDLTLKSDGIATQRVQVLDRNGVPLSISYQTRFNTSNQLGLHEIPPLLRDAFTTSEDRHFFTHHGVDWAARLSAISQNFRAGKKVRGASTITEQVVRILHPRPRNLWSRWVEGFEAMLLEAHASKGEILEFYMNQVPYAANRRGVAQAARYYFNRDLATLTHKEMLALAVLPRAPSALDLYQHPERIEGGIARLAEAMAERGDLSAYERDALRAQTLTLEPAASPLSAEHFVTFIRETTPYHVSENGTLKTTLDAAIQRHVQELLDARVAQLSRKQVHNGAALIVDHTNGEILAWAVARAKDDDTPGGAIDAVRAPRQPGSSMKPFLYALALDSGWSPATILDDAPMAEAIGTGLHDFHNYSHTFYGKLTLREALGNSLNIPALLTIQFVTPARYLNLLHALGFDSLTQTAEFYKDGLALGNGEVSLIEMVRGYATLANRGMLRPLTPLLQSPETQKRIQIYSPEAASLIANILSDPFARRLEFGAGSVLNLPVQTAVKTGTSTDYRDAWVLGFNSRYVVGVWLGNLDQTPMDGVTGSTGPALVLRSIFAQLNHQQKLTPLYLSPKLVRQEICTTDPTLKSSNICFPRSEYFIAGTEPKSDSSPSPTTTALRIVRPSEGLQLAYDPRIPAESQAFEWIVDGLKDGERVRWVLDGVEIATTTKPHYLWNVTRGKHTLTVQSMNVDGALRATQTAHFLVK